MGAIMNSTLRRAIGITVLTSVMFTGCTFGTSESKNDDSNDLLTLDVFDVFANYQGIQQGWFADVIRDKFNIELNIIAPNVSGNGSSLYDSRFAAGNLGDIIICGAENGQLGELVEAGLLLDMTDYIITQPSYSTYSSAIIEMREAYDLNGIYALPIELSMGDASTSREGLAPNYGNYLRWDYYKALGYPEINTLEDLPGILASMQALAEKEYDEPVYAISYFNDWNGNLLNIAKQQCCFYGYDEFGFVLMSADGSDYQNILDRDSLYIRSLKFLNSCYRLGLVDPDSTSQNYNDAYLKYCDGRVLYAPWPWISQDAFNVAANLEQGKGYEFVPISDEKVYSYGCSNNGNQRTFIAVGSKVKDPQRVVDFIAWLYSPEGIAANEAGSSQSAAGPEDLTWTYTNNGPVLTELGKEIFYNGDADIPDDWGGLTWKDGISTLNVVTVNTVETDDYGYHYYYKMWDSVIPLAQSEIDKEWESKYRENTVMKYLIANDQLAVSPGVDFTEETRSTELSSIQLQCSKIIVDYSQQMIYAEDDKEFYDLLQAMSDRAYVLGYETIYEFDLKNAMAKGELIKKVLK